MLDVRFDTIDSVPVLVVKGRLDSYGAAVFDRETVLLDEEIKDLVVEVSDISYVSSLGVRSLIKLEKSLQARSGGIILAGITPFLLHVLQVSGLLSQFRTAGSLDSAIALARSESGSNGAVLELEINERKYTITNVSESGSKLDLWGDLPTLSGKKLTADNLRMVNLAELGPCFGIGGFGVDRFQASDALGEFVSSERFACVIPADGHCISDFIITERPSESSIYVASAIGFSGKPLFLFEGAPNTPLNISELISDLFRMISDVLDTTHPIIGLVMFAETMEIVGSHFRDIGDIISLSRQTGNIPDTKGVMIVGVAADEEALRSSNDKMVNGFLNEIGRYPVGKGRFFHGHGLTLKRFEIQEICGIQDEDIRRISDLDRFEGVVHIEPETRIKNPRVWVYIPSTIRSGDEKLLNIEVAGGEDFLDEWDVITRRIYSDAKRVVLTPIHGGFMSKTFHVTSFGKDARRMLPTVLKIGSTGLTRREEKAYHEYVEKYILNNSTTIMGTASYGDWAGLRYNFVGISGPNSKLSWLTDYYRERPTEQLISIFNIIFTDILKPWYGQPGWEEIYPYVEHDPQALFPGILDDAEKTLAISPDKEILHCPELDIKLPNPFNFLKHQYPKRKGYSRLWYKCITHGDLNMQNILLDEHENIYVIDFSETGPRNAVSDFARVEAILKIEMTRLDNEKDMKDLLETELALTGISRLNEAIPFVYSGSDRMVEKAYKIISLLRNFADRVTIFETDIIPYLLALLEWTYPVVSYKKATLLQKKFAAYSAGLIVKKILELEKA